MVAPAVVLLRCQAQPHSCSLPVTSQTDLCRIVAPQPTIPGNSMDPQRQFKATSLQLLSGLLSR